MSKNNPRLRNVALALAAIDAGPSVDQLNLAPWLVDWQPARSPHGAVLIGLVRGHPELPDGLVRTSALLAIAPDHSWARTLSRWYRLGAPADTTVAAPDSAAGPATSDLDIMLDRLIPVPVGEVMRMIAENRARLRSHVDSD